MRLRFLTIRLKDGELLAKGEVFEHQTAVRPKPAKHGSEPEPKQVKHGNQVRAGGLCRVPCEVVEFTAGQDCDEGQNAKQGFREFQAARRTIQGYEAIHMIRKGQARWVAGDDLLRQIQFIASLFDLVA